MLLYDVNSTADMEHAIDLAAKKNIGYVYVTDCGPNQPSYSNPWDGLPPYWEHEQAHIERINSRSPPRRRTACDPPTHDRIVVIDGGG